MRLESGLTSVAGAQLRDDLHRPAQVASYAGVAGHRTETSASMRVLIVSHAALPHVGGVEVLVHQEIRALIAAGHQVTLLTSDGMGEAQNPQYLGDVRIVRVTAWHGLERRFRLGYPIFAPSLVWRLWRELDWCETVHIHGFMFLSSIVAALLARGRGKTIILTDHGGIQHFQSRVKRLLVRIGAATVGRITARCSTRLVAYNSRIARLLERLAARPGQCDNEADQITHDV